MWLHTFCIWLWSHLDNGGRKRFLLNDRVSFLIFLQFLVFNVMLSFIFFFSLSPSFLYLLSFPYVHSQGVKYGSDDHGVPGTNQSIDPLMYPSLNSWSSAENKVFIKRNLPNLFSPLCSVHPPTLSRLWDMSTYSPDMLCLPIILLTTVLAATVSNFVYFLMFVILSYHVHNLKLACTILKASAQHSIYYDAVQQSKVTRMWVTWSVYQSSALYRA